VPWDDQQDGIRKIVAERNSLLHAYAARGLLRSIDELPAAMYCFPRMIHRAQRPAIPVDVKARVLEPTSAHLFAGRYAERTVRPQEGQTASRARGRLPLVFSVLARGGTPACSKTSDTCIADSDCASNQVCVFAIAQGCSATGSCQDQPTGAACAGATIYCGCDGGEIAVGCGEPSGYAHAPVSQPQPGSCLSAPVDAKAE
jgi:hypothetical protein